MSQPVTVLDVPRDPTTADRALCDLIVDGVPEDYPGWLIAKGVAWHNTVSGAVFVCTDAEHGTWTKVIL